MKSCLAVVFCTAAQAASAVTLTFNSLAVNTSIGPSYSEQGITIESGVSMIVLGGYEAKRMFSGHHWAGGNILFGGVHEGWMSIGAGAGLLDTVSFSYGHDWNLYAIEYGRLTHALDWQAWLGDELVAQGSSGPERHHGGVTVNLGDGIEAFDRLLLRSTATTYESAQWDMQTQQWVRGPGTWSPVNQLAIDNLEVLFAQESPAFGQRFNRVPDVGGGVLLLAFAGLVTLRWLIR